MPRTADLEWDEAGEGAPILLLHSGITDRLTHPLQNPLPVVVHHLGQVNADGGQFLPDLLVQMKQFRRHGPAFVPPHAVQVDQCRFERPLHHWPLVVRRSPGPTGFWCDPG